MRHSSNQPKVSVVITTHNRSSLLVRAIDSVLNQTYQNIEIVIVDDCSNDNTKVVVEAYLIKFSNIIYLKNKINKGAPTSRNIGVKKASGLYIAGLDDDDEFTANRIELFVQNYTDEWSFICSGFYYRKLNKLIPVRCSEEKITLDDMLFANRSANHGFLLRSRYLSINGHDSELVACQDYDFWLRMIEAFGSAFRLAEPTYIVYDDHGLERISGYSNAVAGLKQFINKHHQKMSIQQYKSQQLSLFIVNKKPLPFIKLLKFISTTVIWKAIKYYLTSNFKLAKRIDKNLLLLLSSKD